MTACESVRGEWGGICPDCGQRLPARRPMHSWQSQRALAFPAASARRRGRMPGIITERQIEIARIVRKHDGNKSAAARELGLTLPSVITSMHRYERAS